MNEALHTNLGTSAREASFISYGLAKDLRDQLHDSADNFEAIMPNVASALGDAANSFEATFSAPVTAVDNRVAATAEIGESIRRGMIALRICDAVMKNLYAANTGKLAAWLSASHVERDPKKPTPPTP